MITKDLTLYLTGHRTLWAWLSFLVLQNWARWLPPPCWSAGGPVRSGKNMGVLDLGNIVWDVVVAFWPVTPAGLGDQLAAFLLLRFFDAVKSRASANGP